MSLFDMETINHLGEDDNGNSAMNGVEVRLGYAISPTYGLCQATGRIPCIEQPVGGCRCSSATAEAAGDSIKCLEIHQWPGFAGRSVRSGRSNPNESIERGIELSGAPLDSREISRRR